VHQTLSLCDARQFLIVLASHGEGGGWRWRTAAPQLPRIRDCLCGRAELMLIPLCAVVLPKSGRTLHVHAIFVFVRMRSSEATETACRSPHPGECIYRSLTRTTTGPIQRRCVTRCYVMFTTVVYFATCDGLRSRERESSYGMLSYFLRRRAVNRRRSIDRLLIILVMRCAMHLSLPLKATDGCEDMAFK
jgi:hypothetical protein